MTLKLNTDNGLQGRTDRTPAAKRELAVIIGRQKQHSQLTNRIWQNVN